jgi:hypothetical protein
VKSRAHELGRAQRHDTRAQALPAIRKHLTNRDQGLSTQDPDGHLRHILAPHVDDGDELALANRSRDLVVEIIARWLAEQNEPQPE